MDNGPSLNRPTLPSASVVVQMEEGEPNIQPPPPNDATKAEARWHPALALDESGSTRLKSFAQPRKPAPLVTTQEGHARPLKRAEGASGGSSSMRKLDATERRQLRAQLREASQPNVTHGVGIEELQQEMESLKRAHRSSLTNVQAAERGNGGTPGDTIIDFSGEEVRPNSPQTTSTDSETEISRNGDKVSTPTSGSQTSVGSRKLDKNSRTGSSTTTGMTGEETEDMEFISEAWETFETSWKWQIRITDEEKQNGRRYLQEIDEAYLGFRPRRNDKRKFLKAYPIIGPVPEARLGCNCPMPMTFPQWSFVVCFFIFFIGLGVAGYFYFERESTMS